ncbi:DUF4238 domain-containing protein [Rhodovulum sulfidophilum]|nr:DUF4238 domain-containing protein [Rhodovulum sulfidophilum]
MKNQRSKDHHYIPQALQRAFASGKQQLWYAKKTRSDEYDNPRIRNIRTIFQRRNYYTIYNEVVLQTRWSETTTVPLITF